MQDDRRLPTVASAVQDDCIKYKAGLRTKTIYERQHSVGHDIITCLPLEPAKSYRVPPQPNSSEPAPRQ